MGIFDGLSTSSGTTSTQGSNTPTQIAQYQQGFAADQGALSTANANTAALGTPAGFTAGMTPQQLAAYQSVYGNANGNTSGQTAQNVGALTAGAGGGGVTGALNGYANFNPSMQGLIDAGNQYAAGQDITGQTKAAMFDANQNARDVTLPGIDANAAGTGNINSSRTGVADGMVQRGLAEQSAGISSQLRANAFNTGAALGSDQNNQRIQALGGQGALGVNSVNAGTGALSSGVNTQGNVDNQLLTGAGGNQANTQDQYNNANQAYSFAQNSPFGALSNYMQNLNYNAGGSTTSNQQTTSTPSFMQTAGSLLGAAGSIATGNPLGALSSFMGPGGSVMGNGSNMGNPGAPMSAAYNYGGGYNGATPSFQNGQYGPMY